MRQAARSHSMGWLGQRPSFRFWGLAPRHSSSNDDRALNEPLRAMATALSGHLSRLCQHAHAKLWAWRPSRRLIGCADINRTGPLPELSGVAGDAELASGLGDLAVADGHFFAAGGGAGDCGAELLGGCGGIESFGSDGAVGQDRDDVIGNLHEAAIDVEALGVLAGADAEFAVA
jgi:hypothetical protein